MAGSGSSGNDDRQKPRVCGAFLIDDSINNRTSFDVPPAFPRGIERPHSSDQSPRRIDMKIGGQRGPRAVALRSLIVLSLVALVATAGAGAVHAVTSPGLPAQVVSITRPTS